MEESECMEGFIDNLEQVNIKKEEMLDVIGYIGGL